MDWVCYKCGTKLFDKTDPCTICVHQTQKKEPCTLTISYDKCPICNTKLRAFSNGVICHRITSF